MQKIRSDRHINTLYVTFNVSEKTDMQDFVSELQENCYQLDPGFSCIFELPGNVLSTQVDKWLISCVENLMYEYGLSKIERITEDGKSYDSKVKVVYRVRVDSQIDGYVARLDGEVKLRNRMRSTL